MNTFATTNAEIGEMLTRSSAAMHAANNSLEETIALESAAVEITRNAETTGTAFRTVSMRIRGYDEETEEALENYDELKGKIADLTKTEKTPGGVSLFTDETKTEYKSTYQFLKDISEIYNDISDKDQASLLELIGGKRGAQSLAGILEDFSEVDRAMVEMQNAAGSADAEMDIIRDSISFKLNALKAEWVGTLQEVTDRGDIGNFIDELTLISEKMGNVISDIGLFKTGIVGLLTVIGSQKLGLFNYNKSSGMTLGGVGLTQLFANQNKQILSQGSNEKFLSDMSGVWGKQTTTSDWIGLQAQKYESVNQELITYVQNAKNAGVESSALRDNFIKFGSPVNNLKGAFSKLGDIGGKAIATLGNALVSMGVSLVASYIVQGIQDIINSYDELVAKVGEITQEYTTARDTVDDYTTKLVDIRNKLEDESTTTEEAANMTAELYSIQSDLISTYGSYAAGIDLVNGKLEDQIGILQEINKQNLQQWENEVNSERSNASKAINYGTNVFWGAVNPITSIKKGFTSFTDWLGGKSIKEVSSDFAFGEDWLGIDNGTAILGNNLQQISKKYEDFQDVINATDNSKINEIIDSFEEFEVIDGKIKVKGSVDEVSDAVIRLQTELNNIGYKNDALNQDLVELSKNARSVVESSGETYDTNIFNQIMHSDELAEKYMELTQAYNDYKSAQQTGDIEKAEEALDTYLTKLGDIENSNIEQKYKTYFENMHDDLQAEVDSWKIEFEVAPKIEDTDLESYIFGNSYEEIMSDFQKWGQGVLPDNVENYFETLQKYAGDTGVDILQLIQYLQQLDGFDYAKATGMLKKASSGGNGLSTELQQAAQAYYDAVAQYEKVGADKSTFNSGNVELGQNYDFTTASYSGEGYEIVYTPYVYNPDTGKKEALTTKEINDYIGNIIEEATNQETGEIDFDMVMELDQKGVYNDSTGHVMQNLFMQTGNLGSASVSNYQAEAKAINDRIVAFRDLYNAANDANMSVEEVKSSFSNGLNWDDEQIASFLDSLDEDELSAFLTLDLDDVSKVETEEELRQMIEEAQQIADENAIEIKTKYSETTASLDAMEDAFGGLDTVYESTVTNGETASASDIEQVNSDMGGTTFDEQDISNVNVMSNAIEAYNRTLVENAGDATAAQTAADQLATAYVDQSGVLDGLIDNLDDVTDEQKNWYIEQLKAQGVVNAEEVVNSRLTKQYKNQSAALKSLSTKVTQYRKKLDDVVDSGEDTDGVTKELTDDVNDLLTLYNEAGDETFIPEFDSDFVVENLEDIIKACEGDIDALDRLQQAAARANAEKVLIEAGVDSDVAESTLNDIMSKVAEADAMNIEVGASINDSSFLSALANMYSSSSSTANAIASAFESMGYKVTWHDKSATANILKNGANGMPTDVIQKVVSIPELTITRTSSGSSSASVNYGGSSGGSSSSGGSGGSDSDSEDESEDTFDWVEIAIERLESELSRLDEIIDNTYDTWGKRNEALKNQIEDVTDEIELQSVAAQRYLKEAEDVGLSDEYKKKVQEGAIDIETITDEDLADQINDYQTYWENYQDAMDQIQTLTFELQGYYKEIFENIESEYDDLLTAIEKKTDIIEERITRTEEHGYFVDAIYYEKQLELETENGNKLFQERDELIKAMNNAVTTGKIKYQSEAWYEMYEALQDVNKSLEESYTNVVKLNNAIRQLKWDAFDWIEERVSDISSEADFLIKLLQGELNYEENGQFTNRGFAQAALVGAKYDETLAKAQRYKNEILEVNKLLAEDKNDKNLIERKEELVQAYRDAIEAAEDEKEAMKSLVEEAINKHLESLQKLIDKYKESLETAKDLYDYQKNIADQTKNISNLQKQLAALSGDDSEESRKRRQELTNQLEAAEQQLEETEWDRYISETNDMLDDLYSDYEEYLNGKLDYVTILMNDMIGYLNQHGSNIQAGLSEIKSEYGLTTEYFEDFGKTGKDILSTFNNGDFVNKLTGIADIITEFRNTMVSVTDTANNGVIDIIEKKSADIITHIDGTVGLTEQTSTKKPSGGGGGSTTTTTTKPTGGSSGSSTKNGWVKSGDQWFYYKNGTMQHDTWILDKDGYYYYLDPFGVMKTDEFVEGYWVGSNGQMKPDYFSWQKSGSKWWYGTADGSKYATGKVYIDGQWYTFDDDGWWKGYAKGSKGIPYSQTALTQEDGSEIIYRTGSGALLTPLNRGDMVFTNDMSQRLWDIASGNIPTGLALSPIVEGDSSRNINTTNDITINLPNVQNYDDFKREMKNDSELEKFFQEITVGQLMGNNKLKKNRY